MVWWNGDGGRTWWIFMPVVMLAFWVAVIWVVAIVVRAGPAPPAASGRGAEHLAERPRIQEGAV